MWFCQFYYMHVWQSSRSVLNCPVFMHAGQSSRRSRVVPVESPCPSVIRNASSRAARGASVRASNRASERTTSYHCPRVTRPLPLCNGRQSNRSSSRSFPSARHIREGGLVLPRSAPSRYSRGFPIRPLLQCEWTSTNGGNRGTHTNSFEM